MKSLISVIIPVYNKENYIQNCLNSVLAQSYSNLEIVLINDGSKDNSGEILDEYADKDERVKVFHIENGGVYAARNFGLEKSTGDYVTFIDADDTIELSYIETLFRVLQENNCDIAQCNYSNVVNGIKTPVGDTGEILIQSSEEAIAYIMQGKKYVVGLWPKLYKKSLFVNIPKCTDIKINEDYLVNFIVFQNASKTVFIDLPLYNYFCNDDSVTHTIDNVKSSKDVNYVAKIIMDRSKNKPYEKYAVSRYQVSFLSVYSAIIFSGKAIIKSEKKEWREKLKRIYKGDNYLRRNDRIKAWLCLYCSALYKYSYLVYDKIRKPKLDPEQ